MTGTRERNSDGFRHAVESGDFGGIDRLFSPQVVFRSPAVFAPYEGIEVVRALLTAVGHVFEDFHYLEQVESEDGRFATLLFEARVGDRDVQGVDLLWFDAEGLIAEMTVMVRPLSGLNALVEAMGRMLGGASAS
ncbi:nuclear transport factor 2 family protein [Thermoleophilia bacterium SCSIO 60948]|nr:nuclear transport factor 2 family protein [Thermoleophilia bacterium SCSIO 60948]